MEGLQTESWNMEKKCAPCAGKGKNASAKYICQECKEIFCEDCSVYHISQKYAKSHNLLEIVETTALLESNNKSKKQCEPCLTQDKKADAVMFCEECNELFCEACSSSHSYQKMTKLHKQIHVDQMEPADKILCEPCSESGRSIQAVKYCKICKEALCEKCVIAHESQKATKSHTLVDNIDFLLDGKSDKICEPCKERGNNNSALWVCIECRELLCDACSTMHKMQKATKHHNLIDAVNIPTTLCEPCLEKGEKIAADKICGECEETLCASCTEQHKAQKATRNHRLEDLKLCVFDIKLCDPCIDGKKEIAIKYCEECDEFYCINCSEMHSVQKATRKHKLVEPKTAQTARKATFAHEMEESTLIQDDTKDSRKKQTTTLQSNVVRNSTPRQPFASEVTPTSITLHWEMQDQLKEFSCFQIRFKEKGKTWQYYPETTNKNTIRIGDLKSETTYSFQVRAISDNVEGPYTPESDEVCTKSVKEIRPGKPYSSNQKSDSISLYWKAPYHLEKSSTYQIRYKEKGKKWQLHNENIERATVTICNLQAETTYKFQVRAVTDDEDGPYSPESDEIQSKASLASRLLSLSAKIKDGQPAIYRLQSVENKNARNELDKTRKIEFGRRSDLIHEGKTILLVGATGSGKSTLVDGIINYVAGVNWKDPYRFTLVNLEKDEINKNQALSQTEWITCYTINPEEGSRLNYRLTIIDTPGFGDTCGVERDNKIGKQLSELFSATDEKGVVFIDAVCFLVKAPDARLTAMQKYIFWSIQSLFGKDIENNICMLITFADGKDPPVLVAVKEAELPFVSSYVFNNSGLFASNDDSQPSLSPMFWEMGNKSFQTFFDSLEKMHSKSLRQTQEVLQQRERLAVTIQKLQPQVDAALNKVSELKHEIETISKHKKEIADNEDFEYDCVQTVQVKTDLPKGKHTTNCLHCNVTCHRNCSRANDSDKRYCCVMNNGRCTVCEENCSWEQHANTPYIFTYQKKTVRQTYKEKKKLYEKAGEEMITHEQILERMMDDLNVLEKSIQDMMKQVNDCNNTLKKIALRPNPLTLVEHLDLMIESEKMEKKEGFENRISLLHTYRKNAEIEKDVSKFLGEFQATAESRATQIGTQLGLKARIKSVYNRLFPKEGGQ